MSTRPPTTTAEAHAARALGAAEALDVLTLDQAAALLQVDPSEVAALAEAGELPGRRIGGDWRFPRAALLDWLAAR